MRLGAPPASSRAWKLFRNTFAVLFYLYTELYRLKVPGESCDATVVMFRTILNCCYCSNFAPFLLFTFLQLLCRRNSCLKFQGIQLWRFCAKMAVLEAQWHQTKGASFVNGVAISFTDRATFRQLTGWSLVIKVWCFLPVFAGWDREGNEQKFGEEGDQASA